MGVFLIILLGIQMMFSELRFGNDPEGTNTIVGKGPAMRDDKKIIQRHIDALSANPNLQNIYSMISKSITKQYF